MSAHFYVSPGSHLYVHYSSAQKMLLKQAFVMEGMETPLSFFPVGHRYAQHAGKKRRGDHCIRYHRYLIPEIHESPDVIAFAHKDCNASGSEKVAISPEEDLDLQERDSDGDVVMERECVKR